MTALPLKLHRIAVYIYGILFLHQSSYGLKGYSKINVHAVTDSSLNTSTEVGLCTAIGVKEVVVFASFHFGSTKSTAIFKSFYGINTQHGFSQLSVKLFKNRFA